MLWFTAKYLRLLLIVVPTLCTQIQTAGQDDMAGIQFLFSNDGKSIEDRIRRNKVMVGRCRLVELDGERPIFKIMGPGFNYAPRELFRSRDIAIELGHVPSAEIDRAIIVVRELDNGYELIGYQTAQPTNKDMYLAFASSKRLFDFGQQLYESKNYRYENLIELLIEQLQQEDDDPVKVFHRLSRLGTDAVGSIGAIQFKLQQLEDPAQIVVGINSLVEIGGAESVKAVRARVKPFLIQALQSKASSVRDCLAACRGFPANEAIKTICDGLNGLEEIRRKNNAQITEQFESDAMAMIDSLAAIDSQNQDSIAIFKLFSTHESNAIRKAAQQALMQKN